MKSLNIIGPRVRRLRHELGWSQNKLATKVQLLGMEEASRGKVSKIEARLVWVSDEDLLYLAYALGVRLEELYPSVLQGNKQLYEAIQVLKQSRYGVA